MEEGAPCRGCGALGEAEEKAPLPRCCFQLVSQRFPGFFLAPCQRSRLTPPVPHGLCHAQWTFGPAGMLPGKQKTWGLWGPAAFQPCCSSTLLEAFTLPQPASAEQLFCASYPDVEIPG